MSKDGNSHSGENTVLCRLIWFCGPSVSNWKAQLFSIARIKKTRLLAASSYRALFFSQNQVGPKVGCAGQVIPDPDFPFCFTKFTRCWISSMYLLLHGGKAAAAPLGLIFNVGWRGQSHTSWMVSFYLENQQISGVFSLARTESRGHSQAWKMSFSWEHGWFDLQCDCVSAEEQGMGVV